MKIGLKLWSNNDNYLPQAEKLRDEGLFDFIELYLVPGTKKYLPRWKSLMVPYIIHAPHSFHGFNLADGSRKENNLRLYDEARYFADELGAPFVIIHPGVFGSGTEREPKHESVKEQLKMLNDKRILVENKPYKAVDNLGICAGASPEEIRDYVNASGAGFCLDVNHALKYAISRDKDYAEVVGDFMDIRPKVVHLCGLDDTAPEDKHLHLYESGIDLRDTLDILKGQEVEYYTVETPKNSENDLDDFRKDVICLKKLMEKYG